MKKALILLFVFATTLSFGQSIDVRGFVGFNLLQLTSDEGSSLINGVLHNRTVSGRPGYQFGAAVTFGKQFYVQPGFTMGRVSTKVVNKNNVTGEELTDETTLSTFSIPLKVGVRLINPEIENIFNVRLFAGIDGSHVTSVNHSTKSGQTDDISEDDYSNLIMSADFGMGLDISILFIDLGYQLGISPVYSGGDQAKANAFYGNVGIRISL